jgi:hypothetical protein
MLFSSQTPFVSHLILPTWPNASQALNLGSFCLLRMFAQNKNTLHIHSHVQIHYTSTTTRAAKTCTMRLSFFHLTYTPSLASAPPFTRSFLFSLTHSIQTPPSPLPPSPKPKNNTFANPLLPTRAFPRNLGHIHHPLLLVHTAPPLLRPRLQFPSGLSPRRREQQCRRRRQQQQWSETTRGREWQRRQCGSDWERKDGDNGDSDGGGG